MKKTFLMLAVLMAFTLPLRARDKDEPFQDPSEDNPLESLRRVTRMMSRLSREDLKEDELKRLQKILQDRLTRTLLTLEEQNSDNADSGSGSGSNQRQQKRKRPQQQSGKERQSMKHNNSGSQQQPKQQGNKPQGQSDGKSSGEGEGAGKKQQQPDDKGEMAKQKKGNDRWGKLPPKQRDTLEVNLKRDVPDGYEDDMKDFLKRLKKVK